MTEKKRAKKGEGPSFATIAELRAFKPGEKDRVVRDRSVEGARVIIRPSGRRSYVLAYEIGGVAKKATIVAGLDLDAAKALANARKLAREAQNALVDARAGRGLDPVAQRHGRDRRAAEKAAEEARIAELKAQENTFRSVAEAYLASRDVGGLRPATQTERRRQFKAELLPPWGDRPIASITEDDVNTLLDKVAARAPVMANRLHATLTHFFGLKRHKRFLTANPLADVDRPMREEAPRSRVLSGAELAIVWRAAGTLDTPWREFFRLAILTGARKTELARAVWREFDLDRAEWTLPGERAKNKDKLIRPLAPMAVELLKSLPRFAGSDYIFGAPLKAHDRAKQRLDRAIVKVSGAPLPGGAFTPHDFRRSLATGLQKLGVRLEVSERLLGHLGASQSGVAAIYGLHDFAEEKIAAVGAYSDYVRDLVGPEPEPTSSNVVSIGDRRALGA